MKPKKSKQTARQFFDQVIATHPTLVVAMGAVKTEADARRFLRGFTQSLKDQKVANPTWLAKSHVGYLAGYLKPRQRALWQMAGAAHPVFGTKQPTSKEALQAGVRVGELMNVGLSFADAFAVTGKEFQQGKLKNHPLP